jgi:hypothetical protein
MNQLLYNKPLQAVLFSCFLLAAACKKETEYISYPYSNIVAFSFSDAAGQPVKAAVSGDSLLIYWPAYLVQPQNITPVITISDKATISPASGTPVPLVTGTAYTVTAQNGSTKKYYLKLIQNQPDIYINEESVQSGARGSSVKFNSDKYAFRNIIKDTLQTSFYLVDTGKKEYKMKIEFIANDASVGGDAINIMLPDTLPAGPYKVKIISAVRTKQSEKAFFSVKYKTNAIRQLSGAYTVKGGETITFLPNANTTFNDDLLPSLKNILLSRNTGTTTSPVYTDLATMELVSYTATSATYRFPAGILAAGTYTISGNAGSTNVIFRYNWSPFGGASTADWTNPTATTITLIAARSATLVVTP